MSDKPSVLFVCVHNAGRSQMAAAWLTHLAGDRVEVRSAGSQPGDKVNPAAQNPRCSSWTSTDRSCRSATARNASRQAPRQIRT